MANETIIVKNSDKATQDEADAAAATEPGHLVERAAGGDYGPHGTDAGANASVFAGLPFNPQLEKADTIPADERYNLWHVPRGSGVHVDCIANAAISENDYVVSAGNGEVRSFVAGTDSEAGIIGQATEAAGAQGDRVEVEV